MNVCRSLGEAMFQKPQCERVPVGPSGAWGRPNHADACLEEAG